MLQSMAVLSSLNPSYCIRKGGVQGIIVELPLAPFFLKQLLRKGVDVNDLPTLDAELYRNLMFLWSYEGNIEDLSLTFTVTKDVYGEIKEVGNWNASPPCICLVQMHEHIP